MTNSLDGKSASRWHIVTRRGSEVMITNSPGGKSADRVLVVPAGFALYEYLRYSVYICQPHRFFQQCARMAFYTDNKIDRHIPRILGKIEAISGNEIETRTDISETERALLRAVLKKMQPARSEEWSKYQLKVVFLTPPDSPETLVLPRDIENNLSSSTRRRIAFTQNQRYVTLSSLQKARYTSGLVDY